MHCKSELVIGVIICAFHIVGCGGGAGGSTNGGVGTSTGSEAEVSTVTLVTQEKGQLVTHTSSVARATIQAMTNERKRVLALKAKGIEATFVDDCSTWGNGDGCGNCLITDLWIYDEPNQAGNLICFRGVRKPIDDNYLPNYVDSMIDTINWGWAATSFFGPDGTGATAFYDCAGQSLPQARHEITENQQGAIVCAQQLVMTTWTGVPYHN